MSITKPNQREPRRSVGTDGHRLGVVYLVGAGPGDPDLLTVKALRLLQNANAVVYDRLVADGVLELVPQGVTRIYVGKRDGYHHLRQDEINALLVSLARAGHRVVRLKGGDPFVFGRGGEEALYLAGHGIPFEVVPGVTAATACTAYAGIPLTHRTLGHDVRLLAGHCAEDGLPDVDWASLADPRTTLVFYMGVRNLPRLVRALIDGGRAAGSPAAIIERGTQPTQRRCLAPLSELPSRAQELAIQPPALIVVGEVVRLADQLDWFAPRIATTDAEPMREASA